MWERRSFRAGRSSSSMSHDTDALPDLSRAGRGATATRARMCPDERASGRTTRQCPHHNSTPELGTPSRNQNKTPTATVGQRLERTPRVCFSPKRVAHRPVKISREFYASERGSTRDRFEFERGRHRSIGCRTVGHFESRIARSRVSSRRESNSARHTPEPSAIATTSA